MESTHDITQDLLEDVSRKCEECKEKVALYQCPRCSIRTCSLQCCQAHKKRRKCSGKRNRGEYLPLCRMNDSTLRSDYFFMEEILDVMPRASKVTKLAENGKGHFATVKSMNNPNGNRSMQSINKKAKLLVQQAHRRGITLQIMPPVLERHKTNSSWYSKARNLITWKVEIILIPSNNKFSINLSEQDGDIIGKISKHIADLQNNLELSSRLSCNTHQLLMKRLPSAANNPRYLRIKNESTLCESLKGLTIVEHPTIYCVANEFLSDFPIGTARITEENCRISSSETLSTDLA